MRIDRITDIHGNRTAGFFVRNRADKVLAIGADPGFIGRDAVGFVIPSRKRYARDLSLCVALGKITGQPVKWPLSYYGKHVSSHGEQVLMRIVRNARELDSNTRRFVW
jgi:hypothetical protein